LDERTSDVIPWACALVRRGERAMRHVMRRYLVAGRCLVGFGFTGTLPEQEEPVSSTDVATRRMLPTSRVGALSTGDMSRRYGCAA
jgi:hypothetical protein